MNARKIARAEILPHNRGHAYGERHQDNEGKCLYAACDPIGSDGLCAIGC